MLKNIMSESEMEKYLLNNGYEILTGEEQNIDSCKVVEFALELGYNSNLNEDQELEFTM